MATRGLVVKVKVNKAVTMAIAKFNREVQQKVRDAVSLAAINIETEAKKLSPVDTGRLRSSITHQRLDDGLGALIGSNVFYSPFVELGTNRQGAQPYLTPAFMKERPKFIKRIATIIKKAKP